MRQAEHDPGAVAGRLVGAGGAAMLEAVERDQGAVDRLVDRLAVEAGDAGHAAAVVEERRIVDAAESVLAGGGEGVGGVVGLVSHQSAPRRARIDAGRMSRRNSLAARGGDRTAARKGYGKPVRAVGNGSAKSPVCPWPPRRRRPLRMRARRVSMEGNGRTAEPTRARTVRSRRVRRAPAPPRPPTRASSTASTPASLLAERDRIDAVAAGRAASASPPRRSRSTSVPRIIAGGGVGGRRAAA